MFVGLTELVDWAQVIGVLVQVIVLAVLVWQVRVNARQAVVAEQTLSFARKQHEDSLAQMERDRVDAVRPALAVIQKGYGEGTFIAGDESEHQIPKATYELKNVGRGPAINISLLFWIDGKEDRPVNFNRVQGIAAGGADLADIWFYEVNHGRLEVAYEDLYGNRFERSYRVGFSTDPDGEMYSWLSDDAT